MIVELNYVLFSFILVIYCAWRYYKQKDKRLLYLTLCLTILAMSVVFQMLSTTIWFYGTPIATLTALELGGLALHASFTICMIIVLTKKLEIRSD
jgi:hypothetical protein